MKKNASINHKQYEKLVSVIIPIYNSEEYLSKCLDSIVNQSYNNLEIIIIDDGSDDNSAIICHNYEMKYNNIYYYYKLNGGVSSARNFGLSKSKGYYIMFADCDDLYLKDFIKQMVYNLEKNKCDLCVSNYTTNLEKTKDSNYIKVINNSLAYNLLINNRYFGGYVWNKIYKSNILLKNNITFKENIYMCEDLLLNATYLSYCNKICYLERKLYFYNTNNENSASNYNKVLSQKKLTIIDAYKCIFDIYKKKSIENLDYVYYQYVKILLYLKYLSSKEKKYDFINYEIIKSWEFIKKSKKISLKSKICIKLRILFPFLSESLRYIIRRKK